MGKAGSDPGTVWRMVSLTLGKSGTVVPLVLAWPFWCTLFAGIVDGERRDVGLRFLQAC